MNQFIVKRQGDRFYAGGKPLLYSLETKQRVELVTILKNIMILGFVTGEVGAYDLNKSSQGLSEMWSCQAHQSNMWWLEASEDVLATAGNDGKVSLVDLNEGKKLDTLDFSERACWVVNISKPDDRLIAGSSDGKINFWKLSTREIIFQTKWKRPIFDLNILSPW